MNPYARTPCTSSASRILLCVLLALTSGCGAARKSVSVEPGVIAASWNPSDQDPNSMLNSAIQQKQRREYFEAAESFAAVVEVWASEDGRFETAVLGQAAVCYLAAGAEDEFLEAVDAMWMYAGKWGRRGLSPELRALVALADRWRNQPLRTSLASLPAPLRSLLTSAPVPSWRIPSAIGVSGMED